VTSVFSTATAVVSRVDVFQKMTKCIDYLSTDKNCEEEGIFRIPGSVAEVRCLASTCSRR